MMQRQIELETATAQTRRCSRTILSKNSGPRLGQKFPWIKSVLTIARLFVPAQNSSRQEVSSIAPPCVLPLGHPCRAQCDPRGAQFETPAAQGNSDAATCAPRTTGQSDPQIR